MSGKPYSWEKESYRLMHYKGAIYKFKIQFSGKSPTQKLLDQSESNQVDRTIGVLVQQKYRKSHVTDAIQTADFQIRCSQRPWKIGKKLSFHLQGKELAVHDFMFHLNVEPKQTTVTFATGDALCTEIPHDRSQTCSQEVTQCCGTAETTATETRLSSLRRGPKSREREHDAFTDEIQKADQESKPLPRQLRSGSRQQQQQHETSPREDQRIAGLSPKMLRSCKDLSRNENSPKRMQKSLEVSPRQVRKSPRLLEKSPTQPHRSSSISPKLLRKIAKLSGEEESPEHVKTHPEVSPKVSHHSHMFNSARSSQSSPTKSPYKRRMKEVWPGFQRMSLRSCPASSNQSSPLKSPKKHGIVDHSPPNPKKPRVSTDDTISQRLRSNSAKLSMSEVTATEKRLHPLDMESVWREYEEEESRLRSLAKPSTSSTERNSWLFSL